jgi:MerR family transcriptional regulator, copper efflux regulator
LHIQEIAKRIGVSERTVRHYEHAGLLKPKRLTNTYRSYTEADVRRAARIRDMIGAGYSTRELRMLDDCLSADNLCTTPVQAIECARRLELKLEQIDRELAALQERREIVLSWLSSAREQSTGTAVENSPPPARPKDERGTPRQRACA